MGRWLVSWRTNEQRPPFKSSLLTLLVTNTNPATIEFRKYITNTSQAGEFEGAAALRNVPKRTEAPLLFCLKVWCETSNAISTFSIPKDLGGEKASCQKLYNNHRSTYHHQQCFLSDQEEAVCHHHRRHRGRTFFLSFRNPTVHWVPGRLDTGSNTQSSNSEMRGKPTDPHSAGLVSLNTTFKVVPNKVSLCETRDVTLLDAHFHYLASEAANESSFTSLE